MPVGSTNWTTEIAKINADATSGTPSTAPVLSTPSTNLSASSTPVQAAAMSAAVTEIFAAPESGEGEQSDVGSIAATLS